MKIRLRPTKRYHCLANERGVVMCVALFAVLALTIMAVALARALAMDVAIGGNLVLRQHATLAAADAVERALASLFESGAISDKTQDDLAHSYFASRQPGEDLRAIPRALQSIALYPTDAAVVPADDGAQLRYIIERVCRASGAATADNCTLTAPSAEAASGAPPPGEPPRTAYYRVTVRVDAPGGATTFVQTLLGEEATHHRLTWRVLDE